MMNLLFHSASRSLSIVGAVRTGWYMLYVLSSGGFRRSICDQGFYYAPVSKFWAYAFVLSKAPELGKPSPLTPDLWVVHHLLTVGWIVLSLKYLQTPCSFGTV